MNDYQSQHLLGISQAIATVQDRIDLLRVICGQIQPVLPFDDAGIAILNPAGDQYYEFLTADALPSEVNQLYVQAGYHDHWLPVDAPIGKAFAARLPLLMDIAEEAQQYPNTLYFPLFEQGGIQQAICRSLQVRGQTIGEINFNSQRIDQYSEADFPLFNVIADLVGIAVANILTREEILEREREKSLLLEISATIAQVQNSRQLLKIIYETIRPVFHYDNAGLFVFDQTGENYWEILDTEVLPDETQTQLAQASLLGPYVYKGQHPDLWGYAETTAIYSLPEQGQLFPPGSPERAAFDIGIANGLKQMIGGPLYCGGRKIGLLSFNSKQADFYTNSHLPLFKAITDQIAVAVNNILANEEILEREREKSLLLEISYYISTIRDKVELLQTIHTKLQPIFKFDATGLFIVNEGKNYHYDITVAHPEIDGSAMNRKLFEDLDQVKIPHRGSAVAATYDELRENDSPIVFDFHDLFSKYPHPFAQPILQDGYRETMATLLRVRGEAFGILYFNSKTKGFFGEKHFRLFQSITDQLSVVVANILANEEILEREREKSVLLEITEALSRTGSRQDILQVIYQYIHQLIPFHGSGLFLLNEADDFHQLLIHSQQTDDSTFPIGTAEKIPYHGSAAEWMAQGFTISLLADLEARFPGHPHYPDLRQAGIQQMIHGPLLSNGKIIGMFCLNSQQKTTYLPESLRLFRHITDQLSVAVANILANEEILKREREKANLFAITSAIATIRDKNDLFRVVSEMVRPLLGYEEAAQIFAVDPNDQTIGIFLRNTSTFIADDPDYQQLTRERFTITGSPFEKILAWPTVYLLDPAEEALHYPDYPGFPIMIRMGIRQSMIAPLRYAGRTLGTFHVFSTQPNFFNPTSFPFFETVASQIAVAVANILANEELLEREQEKSLQLAVGQALTESSDWQVKFERLARLLQPIVPYDYAVLSTICPDGRNHQFGFYRTGADEYQVITIDDFLRRNGLTLAQYLSLRNALHQPEALLLNGDDFVRFCHQYAFKKLIAQTYGLHANLVLPIPLSRDCRFTLSLYSRQSDIYQPIHLSRLLKLQSIISLMLDKLLAFEIIEARSEQLKQENTYLLQEVQTYQPDTSMVGFSPAMQAVFNYVSQVAPTTATVLVQGETGTGKELIAHAIHTQSPRRERMMVKLNCATLPAQLIESELFGHERGAFTGAFEKRLGKFELASGSTIFLDEIGEMPLDLQVKLLRVLQEREFERIGGKTPIRTDVRVIAATNRNLQQEVAEGRFRADLYYRLSVFPIHLPPLRERREDVVNLATHFGRKFSTAMHRPFRGIDANAKQELLLYDWPGNIRELENLVEQAVILSNGQPLVWGRSLVNQPAMSLADTIKRPTDHTERDRIFAVLRQTKGKILGKDGAAQRLNMRPTKLEDYEREFLLIALKEANGKVRGSGGAAQLTGLKPNAFDARLLKLGIQKEHTIK